jgi:hypothetical protein
LITILQLQQLNDTLKGDLLDGFLALYAPEDRTESSNHSPESSIPEFKVPEFIFKCIEV